MSRYAQEFILEMKKDNPFLEEAKDAFTLAMSRLKIKRRELAYRLGMTTETLRYKLNDPGRFTVGEFVVACQVLNINPKTLNHE